MKQNAVACGFYLRLDDMTCLVIEYICKKVILATWVKLKSLCIDRPAKAFRPERRAVSEYGRSTYSF